jgi:maltooligosyltrehalose synthase
MRGQQITDVSRELHAAGSEDDEVVAHALQVSNEVGGQHNAHAVPVHDLHEALEELSTSQGVKA